MATIAIYEIETVELNLEEELTEREAAKAVGGVTKTNCTWVTIIYPDGSKGGSPICIEPPLVR